MSEECSVADAIARPQDRGRTISGHARCTSERAFAEGGAHDSACLDGLADRRLPSVKLWPLIAVGRVVVALSRIVEETGVALDLLHEPVNEGIAVLLGGVPRLMGELEFE